MGFPLNLNCRLNYPYADQKRIAYSAYNQVADRFSPIDESVYLFVLPYKDRIRMMKLVLASQIILHYYPLQSPEKLAAWAGIKLDETSSVEAMRSIGRITVPQVDTAI